MSPTQEYRHGRSARALAIWGAELAAGREWTEVEAEIIACCEGRVDLLTGLLIQAETVRVGAEEDRQPTSARCRENRTIPSARHPQASRPDRPTANTAGTGRRA